MLARQVPAASEVVGYASRLLLSLQPTADADAAVREYVRLGPSPRGGQALTLAGRIAALLDGRHNLAIEDIRAVALPALVHRLVLNFDAERDGGRRRRRRDRGAAAPRRPRLTATMARRRGRC